jgi:Spy/CpxP family protein refolding chaperone
MTHRIHHKTTSLAAIMLLGAATFAAPSHAMAQTANPAPATEAQKPIDKTEARIKEMHAKLKITAAQEPQWQDFVTAQRDTAEKMSDLIEKRETSAKTMNAVDDFKNYEEIAETHADGLKKVVSTFTTLYGTFSDDQKKAADAIFKGGMGSKRAS